MPIYTYICKKCAHKFELLLGVTSQNPEIRCSRCGSKDVKKVFSSFSVGNSNNKSSGSSGSSCPTGTCPLG